MIFIENNIFNHLLAFYISQKIIHSYKPVLELGQFLNQPLAHWPNLISVLPIPSYENSILNHLLTFYYYYYLYFFKINLIPHVCASQS